MSMFSRFTRRAAFGFLSLSAVALLLLGGCDSGGRGGRSKAVNTEVEIMTVAPQDVEFSRMITGRTAPVLLAEVRPQVSGIIKERLFAEGADVKAGDVLYLIDDAIYKASYKSAQAALNKVEANNNVLKVKLARFKAMLARKAVSQQDYDDLEALYKSSSAEVRVQKALVDEARIQYEYTASRPLSPGASAFPPSRPARWSPSIRPPCWPASISSTLSTSSSPCPLPSSPPCAARCPAA